MKVFKKCSIVGCEKISVSKGYCSKHYQQRRKEKKAEKKKMVELKKQMAELKRKEVCIVDYCTEEQYKEGLCHTHYKALVKKALEELNVNTLPSITITKEEKQMILDLRDKKRQKDQLSKVIEDMQKLQSNLDSEDFNDIKNNLEINIKKLSDIEADIAKLSKIKYPS